MFRICYFILASFTIPCTLGYFSNIAHKAVCLMKDECCLESSIPGNLPLLRSNLNDQIFGQHIAVDMVINAITGHWNSPFARKPLTMSFHGWTGSGKNYISQIIASSLYTKGMKSKYVHLFNAGIDFPELSKVSLYKEKLYKDIAASVADCPRQLFIFDDVHAMPAGVLDSLRTIMDYHESVQNVDYRKCIFIFLSNTGALSISQHFMELWRSGRRREDIELADFETMISQGAFNEEGNAFRDLPLIGTLIHAYNVVGGFFRSETIKKNLIDHYVPFLPMEKRHVRKCVQLEFSIRGISAVPEYIQEDVISFVEWGPPPEKMFAKTGCKRLSQKVAAIVSKLESEAVARDDL